MQETLVESIFEQMETETPHFIYATNGQRLVNSIIDTVVFYVGNFVMGIIFGISVYLFTHSSEAVIEASSNKLAMFGLSLFTYVIVYTINEALGKGRSLGKMITGTVAVREADLSRIGWKEAFLRTLSRLVPFEAFSIFSGIPWHDKWTRTIVIKKRPQVFND